MTTALVNAIALMNWDDFEERLRPTQRSAKRAGALTQALQDYFGEEYEQLQRLAEHARFLRETTPPLGNVVFLHGIMGANLSIVEKNGAEDLIWLQASRLIDGQLERLKLAPDGRHEADPGFTVQPTTLDRRAYARTILWLRARWNTQPFAYDWRRDIDDAADALAHFIREQFADEPVHLIAHSMGGLVCRNFIRRHGDFWQALHDREGNRGGRLIMLGVPNFGSFTMLQTLSGREKLVKQLAAIDLDHSVQEVMEILNSFVGSYQLLPSPSKISPAMQALYRQESWGALPISEAHLRRAFQFHLDLERADAVDPERMAYIAGCNQETLAGVTILSPGEFAYTTTTAGDGRVPHELGLLKEVPTYYVEEAHGDLAKNEKVLTAIDELLEHGETMVLPKQPPGARALSRGSAQWRRAASEHRTAQTLRTIAETAKRAQAAAEDLLFAEDLLWRATLGRADNDRRATIRRKNLERKQQAERIRLRLTLLHGDITQVSAPVIVVGHYKGVEPVGDRRRTWGLDLPRRRTGHPRRRSWTTLLYSDHDESDRRQGGGSRGHGANGAFHSRRSPLSHD